MTANELNATVNDEIALALGREMLARIAAQVRNNHLGELLAKAQARGDDLEAKVTQLEAAAKPEDPPA